MRYKLLSHCNCKLIEMELGHPTMMPIYIFELELQVYTQDQVYCVLCFVL